MMASRLRWSVVSEGATLPPAVHMIINVNGLAEGQFASYCSYWLSWASLGRTLSCGRIRLRLMCPAFARDRGKHYTISLTAASRRFASCACGCPGVWVCHARLL